MAKGKIKSYWSDKKFGFIADDAGGRDVFFHVNASIALRDNESSLIPGARVNFERRPSQRKKGSSEAYNVRVQPDSSSSDFFHNPYTFIPSPPRRHIQQNLFAGDFDPIASGLTHDTLGTSLWTGHLPIKLTAVTPLLLLDADTSERASIKPCNTLDHLPESSLRGMLRNAYETVTNSRYACFRNDDRLAYRMAPQEALKLVPAIIEQGSTPGMLQARLYPGTSHITKKGPQGPMYAAMLTCYPQLQSKCTPPGYTPKTGDEVWAEIDRCRHSRGHSYWKVLTIRPKRDEPKPRTTTGTQYVCGRVLITNENISRKHDERIFFGAQSDTFNVTQLQDAWRMRIQSYREAHSEDEIFGRSGSKIKPWKKIGSTPGKTAWSPHLYQNGNHSDRWGRKVHDAIELQPGDMVYARCQFGPAGKIMAIKDLFPVMISRELYDASPAELLDGLSLKPAVARNELSPADRLFGWVPQRQGQDSGYKGRIRVVCEDGARPEIVQDFGGKTLPLAILGQPKPAQGRFYVAKNTKGEPQQVGMAKSQAGYSQDKALRGRKQYWHHKGLEYKQAPDYWRPSVKDRTQRKSNGRYQEYRRPDANNRLQIDSQNRSIRGWIKPGTVFKAILHVQNLQSEEVGALLWLLSRSSNHCFRLGYGKPLGFGSVQLEIDQERCGDKNLPLGSGEDWKRYYAVFNASPPATLDMAQQADCIRAFKAGMVSAYENLLTDQEHQNREERKEQLFNALPFINGFLQVLRGPESNVPIHYPRSNPKPDPQGKNFRWFTQNEEKGKHSLPAVTDRKGLPYHS